MVKLSFQPSKIFDRPRWLWLAFGAGLVWVATASDSYAQGMFGSRNIGGSVAAGSRSLTSSPNVYGGAGTGGGVGGGTTSAAQGDVGGLSGNERFLRDNRQPGQFVGTTSGNTFNPYAQTGGGTGMGGGFGNTGGLGGIGGTGGLGGGGLGGLGGGYSQFSSGLGGRAGQGGRTAFGGANPFATQGGRQGSNRLTRGGQTYRVQLVPDFEYSPPPPAQIQFNVVTRLSKMPTLRTFGDINIDVSNRHVILTGVVVSERARRVAEQLIRLEPGVDTVENNLVVSSDLPSIPPATGSDQP